MGSSTTIAQNINPSWSRIRIPTVKLSSDSVFWI